MTHEIISRPKVIPAAGLLAVALGAATIGALAIGALAIGRMAIGRLAIGKAHFAALEVDDLKIHRLHVVGQPEEPRS